MTRFFKAKRMTENGRSMRSKGLALLLSAMLAVGLLGGCGVGDSGTGETGAEGDADISGFLRFNLHQQLVSALQIHRIFCRF